MKRTLEQPRQKLTVIGIDGTVRFTYDPQPGETIIGSSDEPNEELLFKDPPKKEKPPMIEQEPCGDSPLESVLRTFAEFHIRPLLDAIRRENQIVISEEEIHKAELKQQRQRILERYTVI